jgi:hypothetical protein
VKRWLSTGGALVEEAFGWESREPEQPRSDTAQNRKRSLGLEALFIPIENVDREMTH